MVGTAISSVRAAASGLRGLVAHGVRVLLHLLRGKILLLPLPHLVESGEGVDVSQRVRLETLVEVGFGHGAAQVQVSRQVVDGLNGGAQGRAGENGHRDSQLVHLLEGEARGDARLVVEDGAVDFLADAPNLVHARGPFDEGEIGPRFQIGIGPADGLLEATPVRAPRVGAGDEHEVRVEIATDGVGRATLAHRLLDGDHATPRHVTASLGNSLVLEVDARHPRLDVLPHGADDPDGVAVAVVGVGNDGHGHRIGDVARVQVHLRHGGEPGVGQAEEGQRRAVSRHVHGGKTHGLEDLGAQRVVAARNEEGLAGTEELSQLRRGAHESSYGRGANFSSIACHQSKPTLRKISIGDSTGPSCQSVPVSFSDASARSMAGTAAAMHTAGKITILKPIRSSSGIFMAGVLPPGTMFARRGALTSRAIRWISSSVWGASTKITSAPASAARLPRSMASSRLVTARASVRAMMTKSGSVRYSLAARILSQNSWVGMICLPAMWPHFFGATWSSMCNPATPARSYSRTVRTTFRTLP